MRKVFILILLLVLSSNIIAQRTQEASGDEKIAKQFFLFGDYYTALKEYEFLYARDSSNSDYYYPLGICYLNTNINKLKAIPLLEKVTSQKDFDPEAMYELGVAYQVAYRFEEAIECFSKFKHLLSNGKDPNYISADRQIEMCESAIELVKHPINVTFENLGPRINSPYPDFNPYVNKKETVLYYTSKRQGNIGNLQDYDGYFTSDVFMSENMYGAWTKCKRLAGTINTPLIEETGGLSADGSYLFLYCDNLDIKMQLCLSVKQGKSFQRLISLGNNINQPKQGANAAAVSSDKKVLFFSSAMDGGQGGSDIYMSKLLPSGQWGPAENIGKAVNTSYDEDYPYLAPDGKTLYFASLGYNSMGGFDIFKTTWNREKNTFTEPVNIGYPVNTPEDNTTISFTGSGRFAYISALRSEDTYGNLDIYRVIFNNVKPEYTTIIGNITENDSSDIFEVFTKNLKQDIDSLVIKTTDTGFIKLHNISDSLINIYKLNLDFLRGRAQKGPAINIEVYKASDNSLAGIYKPNAHNRKFIMILTPGEFVVKINSPYYEDFSETIKIENREIPVKEITHTFRLQRKK
ncbi:MAG: hypothetical protein PHR81_07340 [Bacteroidales bacterium]|nr:hypothetical protein [Bacteroidales bacterium]MDD4214611.1 hypothetical protein [Bacteroidales bacterium]